MGSHCSAAPFAVVRCICFFCGRGHKLRIKSKQSAIEFRRPLAIGIATKHIAEQFIVTDYLCRLFVVGLYPRPLPVLVPPLGRAFLRYSSSTAGFAKVNGEATLFHFSREVPCPIVGIGIVTFSRTFIYESRCLHRALHSKTTDGIINLILDFFQEFPLHGIVENRLLTVLVKEM